MNSRLLALVALAALALPAQTPRALTLRDAVRLALEQNPEALLARLDEERAQQAVAVARSAFSPAAYIGSGLGYTNGIPQSVEGSTPSVVQATGRMTVYDRTLSQRVKQARAEADAASHSVAASENEVAYRVSVAYLDFEQALRTLNLAEQRSESLQRAAEIAAARLDDGRVLPIDVARARLEAARAREQLELRRQRLRLLERALQNVLGLEQQTPIEPGGFDELAALPLPDSSAASARRAAETSPDLRRLEAESLAKEFAVSTEKGALYPRLDFIAQYSLLARFNNYDDFFNRFQRHNGQIGLALSAPIFAGSGVQARVAQARIEARRLEVQRRSRRADIELEAERLYFEQEQAEAALRLAKLELDVARQSLGVLLAQFDEGRIAGDVLERGRVEESSAWESFYEAQYARRKAQLNLLRRTGDLATALH